MAVIPIQEFTKMMRNQVVASSGERKLREDKIHHQDCYFFVAKTSPFEEEIIALTMNISKETFKPFLHFELTAVMRN